MNNWLKGTIIIIAFALVCWGIFHFFYKSAPKGPAPDPVTGLGVDRVKPLAPIDANNQ